ncbi:MAG: hypothetical protein RIA63_07945, partial [Cyclobacteriaceae bacterium]
MRILIAIVFTLATIRTMAQSPWVAGKGKGFAQVGFTTIGPYGNLFTSDGSDFPLRNEITDRTIQLFGEFGITESTS